LSGAPSPVLNAVNPILIQRRMQANLALPLRISDHVCLPLLNGQLDSRKPRVLLDFPCENGGVRGDPELCICRGAHDKFRERLEQVGMQTGFRLVESEQRRGTGTQERCTETEKT